METQTGTMIQRPPLMNALKSRKACGSRKVCGSKMRLKKIDFELKRKELEMEVKLFEEEGALKLEYEKEALDVRAPNSDDRAAPSIRSISPFNWKTPKNKDVSVGSITYKFSNLHDYNSERTKTRIDNNYPRLSFNREGVLSHGHQVESVPAQHGTRQAEAQ